MATVTKADRGRFAEESASLPSYKKQSFSTLSDGLGADLSQKLAKNTKFFANAPRFASTGEPVEGCRANDRATPAPRLRLCKTPLLGSSLLCLAVVMSGEFKTHITPAPTETTVFC